MEELMYGLVIKPSDKDDSEMTIGQGLGFPLWAALETAEGWLRRFPEDLVMLVDA